MEGLLNYDVQVHAQDEYPYPVFGRRMPLRDVRVEIQAKFIDLASAVEFQAAVRELLGEA